MQEGEGTPKSVIIRDMVIFYVKLSLDGLKDFVLFPLALVATGVDVFIGTGRKGPRLYRVMKLGERFDLWLNLWSAAKKAEHSKEGLFAASEPDDDTLLGELERLSRKHGRSDRGDMSDETRR